MAIFGVHLAIVLSVGGDGSGGKQKYFFFLFGTQSKARAGSNTPQAGTGDSANRFRRSR